MFKTMALLTAAVAMAAGGFVAAGASAAAGDSLSPGGEAGSSSCSTCHSHDISLGLPSGEKLPLKVNPEAFSASVHGGLQCTDCHRSIPGYPHPQTEASTIRDYEVSQKNVCMDCHTTAYNEMSNSAHQVVGDNLICSDCHSTHYMTPPAKMNEQVSATCDKCHQAEGQIYQNSVHGGSLTEANADLPSCADCHGAHQFEMRPSRLESVALCSNCHSNAELMDKYGISTKVVSTYFQDYHGKTAALQGKQSASAPVEVAVCTDCHGVHDIQKVDGANAATIQSNLAITCRNCHTEANANLAGAWLSHTEPGPKKAPLVFLVEWFYRLMIPFIVAGLLIHIGLDLRRARKAKGG